MPAYRIHKLREHLREQFRWAPHTSGATSVKPRDYTEAGTLEAATPYAAWIQLRDTPAPLEIGDLLEVPGGELLIHKYVGFEEARWSLPGISSGVETEAPPPATAPSAGTPAEV
jgi:hypothetical protein